MLQNRQKMLVFGDFCYKTGKNKKNLKLLLMNVGDLFFECVKIIAYAGMTFKIKPSRFFFLSCQLKFTRFIFIMDMNLEV